MADGSVHPGSYCAPIGATGTTVTGTGMVCRIGPNGGRARWGSDGTPRVRRPRPSRARGARRGGLPVADTGITVTDAPVPEPAATPAPATENPTPALTPEQAADKLRDAIKANAGRGGWARVGDIVDNTSMTPEQIQAGVDHLIRNDPTFSAEPDPLRSRVGRRDREIAPVIDGEGRDVLKFDEHRQHPVTQTPTHTPPITPESAATSASTDQAKPAPADGHYSNRAPMPNNWGGLGWEPGTVMYHGDGPFGSAISSLGPDGRIDMGDGQPLADQLGTLASQVAVGDVHPRDIGGRLRDIRDRLPENSPARRRVDSLLDQVDYPVTPSPAATLPTNAPAPLRKLIDDLHEIPLCRKDPRETTALVDLANQIANRKAGMSDIRSQMYRLSRLRHESYSDVGRQQIGELFKDAEGELLDWYRQSRASR